MKVNRIIQGDCRDVLAKLPAKSVQMVVTSPPYYGLRDYGTAVWNGGDTNCDHLPSKKWIHSQLNANSTLNSTQTQSAAGLKKWYRNDGSCPRCGAVRTDKQIGLEQSPEEFVGVMVDVLRAVRRVLRDDGTVWLNLGDTYANPSQSGGGDPTIGKRNLGGKRQPKVGVPLGLKPKDLMGMPWRVALALQADGWFLRQDIIWAKPNNMPGSQTDRCTTAHEYVFLLTKKPRYYFDWKAIEEPAATSDPNNSSYRQNGKGIGRNKHIPHHGNLDRQRDALDRRKRSVWTVPIFSFRGSHFATFPPRLITPMIRAGTSKRGACPDCGAPWVRQIKRTRTATRPGRDTKVTGRAMTDGNRDPERHVTTTKTVGWSPSCECGRTDTVPCIILDPFMGAGTSGLVAKRLGRDYLGIELNEKYIAMAEKRINGTRTGLGLS